MELIEGFRLSPRQQELWRLRRDFAAPHAQCAILIEGALRPQLLRESLARLVRRHEVLRTAFRLPPGLDVPLQVVNDPRPVELCEMEWPAAADPRGEREAVSLLCVRERAAKPRPEEEEEMLRATLVALGAGRHVLALTLPALCADPASLVNIFRELGQHYAACINDQHLEDEVMQFVNFSEWQHALMESEEVAAGREFWEQERLLEPPTPRLPGERAEAAGGYVPGEVTVTAEAELARRLAGVAGSGAEAAGLLACWQGLLWRLTGGPELSVEVAFSGRKYEEMHEALGLYGRWLPIRCNLSKAVTFKDIIGKVTVTTDAAYSKQEFYGPEKVRQPSGVEEQAASFPIAFEYHDWPEAVQTGGLVWGLHALSACPEPFKLRLLATSSSEGLRLSFHYDAARFDREAVSRLAEQYLTLLRAAVSSPDAPLGALPLLGEDERRLLLEEWQGERVEFAQDRCLHQLIEEQAALHPDRAAVVYEGEKLTFAQLNARANQLARRLREFGVGPDVPVGVMTERGVEAVVALLGVMKAGGAYLPLDPSYPRERISFMLEDSALKVLLAGRHLAEGWPGLPCQVVALDAEREAVSRYDATNPENVTTPDNLAYVVYTSGSTGRPKGVLNTHRGAVNRFRWMWETYPFAPGEVCSQKTSLNFVDSVWEIFGPLLKGVPLVVIPDEVVKDPLALINSLSEHGVTRITVVPSLLRAMLDAREDIRARLPKLKYWTTSGEALTGDLLQRFRERLPEAVLLNLYGSSEVAADVTWFEPRGEDAHGAVPIGRPIANTQIYLLDTRLQPVPVGTTGELYVGGAGLARGYLRRAGLTAEKFIPDPFGGGVGARLYRTGDLARYRPGGELEFLGRVDHQVKVRGYRIELGEIESALAAHASVGECVVAAREDVAGDKRLVAYVVGSAGGQTVTAGELREHLRSRLPEYMVPSAFVRLSEIPLTPNRKVDRGALPAPEAGEGIARESYEAPRTPVEEVLAGIWAELLRVRQVGVNDNYFALGGHSLLATQLMSRVWEAFGVEVALRKLFEEPTVAGLAAHVEGLLKSEGGRTAPPLVRASREGRLPLSFAQQRLWFIDRLEPANPFYNIPVAVRLSGVLDVGALERTLSEIVRRHEALRTHFAEVDGEPVQVISPAEPLPLPLTNLSHLDEEEREAEARLLTAEAARTPFVLDTPPLIKGRLLRLSAEEHVVLLTMHHVVSDGWSTGVLIKEVAALYRAFSEGRPSPLAEREIQYADYAVWQRGWLQGEALEEQLAYWRKQLGGTLPVLELPTGRPRPAVGSHRGRTLSFTLPREAADRLRELSRREGVTLFMTLLAAFQALLHRYTGQDDIVVGTPIAGRNRRETEGLIGFFVNTLALRTDLSGDPSFRELLRRVREVTLSAYAHQDVPFEKLVEELRPNRSPGRTPLFQVMFALQNVPDERLELPGLGLRSVKAESTTAKFDLKVTAVEGAGGELRVGWNYREELYEAAAVGRMAGHFGRVLEGFAGEPERRVSELVKASAADSSGGRASGRSSPGAAAAAGLFKSRPRPTPSVRRSPTETTG